MTSHNYKKDVDNLVDWSDKWLLRFHPDKYRRERGDMIQTFKLTTDFEGYDKQLPSLLQRSTTGLRGHNKKLFVQGANKDIKKFSFQNRVTNNWNNLPQSAVSSKNTKDFEIFLDSFWKNQPLVQDDLKSKIKNMHKF